MIKNCPACGVEIYSPYDDETRSHATKADCLRALLVEEQQRHKVIVKIMNE